MEMLSSESTRRASGWSGQENDLLMREVEKVREEGQPIRLAFDRVAQRTGRKPNSVRNYYYLSLRQQPSAAMPVRTFTCFTQEEKRDLLVAVLSAQAKGQSVRRCVMELAKGDKREMLRYQNKYRSLIKNHPDTVREVMNWMDQQGIIYANPYERMRGAESPETTPVTELTQRLAEQLQQLGEEEAVALLEGLLRLTGLASARVTARWKADEYDRLSVRYDLLVLQMQDLLEKTPAN